eukprot:13633-Heterococcus_DN1.PRE.2
MSWCTQYVQLCLHTKHSSVQGCAPVKHSLFAAGKLSQLLLLVQLQVWPGAAACHLHHALACLCSCCASAAVEAAVPHDLPHLLHWRPGFEGSQQTFVSIDMVQQLAQIVAASCCLKEALEFAPGDSLPCFGGVDFRAAVDGQQYWCNDRKV